MTELTSRTVQAHTRTLIQSAKFAIRDIYDAIVELVTNADDRYQVLGCPGQIDIEVERRRGANSLLRVRDMADGMDSKTMEQKLSWMGGRESGLEEGANVRGTHSRGAKDVAAMGHVTFESIAKDGFFHKCEISPYFEFVLHKPERVSKALRTRLGISSDTGTLVTIELDKTQTVPQHDNLRDHICRLVTLQGILGDSNRTVCLIDAGRGTTSQLIPPRIQGSDRCKETLEIPGYPGVTAKLIIKRAKKRFERESNKFRMGGIRIESKHAIHEATLFDSSLETDASALWFYGRLVCPYIDQLCIEFDDRVEAKLPPEEKNPTYLLDPSRHSGLVREHPFVKAVFGEALKRLRPLVEEERKREEGERSRIENEATRKRLNALQKAAMNFMRDYGDDEEAARDPNGQNPESRFMERGYALSPPYAQIIVGHSRLFWLSVKQDVFPELEVGSSVQIHCFSDELESNKSYVGLEPHPVRDGVLRATWKVKAIQPTTATGVRVRVGPITAESIIEILASEADKYKDVNELRFSRAHYTMSTEQKKKKIQLIAPLEIVPTPTEFEIESDSPHLTITGQCRLQPQEELGVSVCDLWVKCDGSEAIANLTAFLGENQASAKITARKPLGADLSIQIEDVDLGNQRYRWRQNVLEIAARHLSLKRYLGNKEHGFPGQDSKHFRILVAEIVADAVCARLVRRSVQANPEEYEDADWDAYYAQYSKYLTQFLPIAHQLQCPET